MHTMLNTPRRARRARAARGFSIVELMVVIAIVAVLLGILIPVLASARAQARTTVTLANLRQTGLTFERYLARYSETYPFVEPGVRFSTHPDGEPATMSTTYPFQMRMFWPALMHTVAPWREHYRTWVNPGAPVEPDEPWRPRSDGSGVIRVYTPSYLYSQAFQARPRLFSPNPPSDANELLALIRPVRSSDVTHPSSKALLYDDKREYLPRPPTPSDPRGVLAADGSAALRQDANAIDPVPNPLNGGQRLRYSDTPGGAGGRDW